MMKMENTKLEQLLHILDDDNLCKQLLNEDDCSFLDGKLSKQYYQNEFSRLLNSTVFLMKKTKNFHYLPIVMKILNQLYLKKMKEDPFMFYNNKACIDLLNLLDEYPEEFQPFKKFLEEIHFEEYQMNVGKFYFEQMKKNRILNDFELKDFLNYLMLYKNRVMPHHYLCYLFYVIFEKDHELQLSKEIYAELFRFLILDILSTLNWSGNVEIVSLEEEKPFIYEEDDIYINLRMIKETLEKNLAYFPYLFDLFEKRYKYKSFGHNKYEEMKSKKQNTIKEILGSNFFYEGFSYLSIEREIADQSLIARLRFFEEVAPMLYRQIIEDYEKQILSTMKHMQPITHPVHHVLTLDDLMEQTILLNPDVISNRPYLLLEYHQDGKKKRLAELLADYERELELAKTDEMHFDIARYYKKIILTTSLPMSRLIDEFALLVQYPVKLLETETLLERIFCEYLVSEINDNIQNQMISQTELNTILSKFNEYMLKYYEIEQKRISKYLAKDSDKWHQYNNHLAKLYRNVQYMSNEELYENPYLDLTHSLETDDAKKIQKKVLKKKIMSQRIYIAVMVLLIVIFSVSLFLLARIYFQYWTASDSYGKIQKQVNIKPIPNLIPDPNRTEFPINDDIPQVDFRPLKETNNEVIAWIRIDDTEINYPVVQGTDNDYYLEHLYNKKYNISGSIFADYRNNDDFSSDNMVLYGHNMKNGSMFGSLKKYKDASYFETHKYVWLITPKATYQYEIYAAYEFNSIKEQYVFNFNSMESFQAYLDKIRIKSIISSELEVKAGDHILTLSTCMDDPSIKRFIVVAKRVVTYVAPDNGMSN